MEEGGGGGRTWRTVSPAGMGALEAPRWRPGGAESPGGAAGASPGGRAPPPLLEAACPWPPLPLLEAACPCPGFSGTGASVEGSEEEARAERSSVLVPRRARHRKGREGGGGGGGGDDEARQHQGSSPPWLWW